MEDEPYPIALLREALEHARQNANVATERRTLALFYVKVEERAQKAAGNYGRAMIARALLHAMNAAPLLTTLMETLVPKEQQAGGMDPSSNTGPTSSAEGVEP